MTQKPTRSEEAPKIATAQDIEVIAMSDNLWKARLVIPSVDISDREMVIRARGAKKKIAEEYHVPIELLEFREVLSKENTYIGVIATISIGRIAVGKGKMVLRTNPLKAPGGELFADMVAYLDFYYLDEFDQPVTMERLLSFLDRNKVSRDLLDMEALREALEKVTRERSLIERLEVARGRFPSKGTDAELEYTFYAEPGESLDLTEYRQSRKVKEGDILCQKIPARDGKESGVNIRGETILPLKGIDFTLAAGEGAKLSLDGNRITATQDGLAVMTRTVKRIYTAAGKKIVPDTIEVKVKPILTIRSEEPIKIAVNESVEISGNLKEGSAIRSSGEVFLDGDIEGNTRVIAGADIVVNGEVQSSEILSDSSVLAAKDIRDSNISARQTVEVRGVAENSNIEGENVKIGESLGSRIFAAENVQVNKTGNDARGRKTTISVNKKKFYTKQIQADLKTIDSMATSLDRIQDFFGKDYMERIQQENLQKIFLEELERLRSRGFKKLNENQINSLKKLLGAVKPLNNALSEKINGLSVLQSKVSEADAEKPIVVIREKIQDPIDVTIDEVTQTIEPSENGMIITTAEGGGLLTRPLPEQANESEDSERAEGPAAGKTE
jgi:uncharacterized protein (DUF342 family)